MHVLLEREIKKVSNVSVSCKKGCAACCHFEVEITSDDAKVLQDALSSDIQIDIDRLLSLAKGERQGRE